MWSGVTVSNCSFVQKPHVHATKGKLAALAVAASTNESPI